MNESVDFPILVRLSNLLAFCERGMAIITGPLLLAAVLIAGADMTLGGVIHRYFPAFTAIWVLGVIVGCDTQFLACVRLLFERKRSGDNGAAAFWSIVVACLAYPAFVVNAVFGLQAIGAASSDNQAMQFLHLSPIAWVLIRAAYVVSLMFLSVATRPHGILQPVAAPIVLTPVLNPTPEKPKRHAVGYNNGSAGKRSGVTKLFETRMRTWREEEAKRLLEQQPDMSTRQLARQLTYQQRTCSPSVAQSIRDTLQPVLKLQGAKSA